MDPIHVQPDHRLDPVGRLLRLRCCISGGSALWVAHGVGIDGRRIWCLACCGEDIGQGVHCVAVYVSLPQWGTTFGVGYGVTVFEQASHSVRVDSGGAECVECARLDIPGVMGICREEGHVGVHDASPIRSYAPCIVDANDLNPFSHIILFLLLSGLI